MRVRMPAFEVRNWHRKQLRSCGRGVKDSAESSYLLVVIDILTLIALSYLLLRIIASRSLVAFATERDILFQRHAALLITSIPECLPSGCSVPVLEYQRTYSKRSPVHNTQRTHSVIN